MEANDLIQDGEREGRKRDGEKREEEWRGGGIQEKFKGGGGGAIIRSVPKAVHRGTLRRFSHCHFSVIYMEQIAKLGSIMKLPTTDY